MKTTGITLAICLLLSTIGVMAQSPREKISLDAGWRFHLGHATNPQLDFNYASARLFAKTAENYGTCIVPEFNDTTWQQIDLPHDWLMALPFDAKGVMSQGYKPVGSRYPENSIGWYRKSFSIDESRIKQRRAILTFDGVFRNCEVWVNNFYMGRQFSGYNGFSFDITDVLRPGKTNVVTVRVDVTHTEGWFYEGAGIYRHVWLTLHDNLHFQSGQTFVYSNLNEDFSAATIHVENTVENYQEKPETCQLVSYITDNKGKRVTDVQKRNLDLPADGLGKEKVTFHLSSPSLWDVEDPHLYKAVSEIRVNNQLIDRIETRFGIRSIVIDPQHGLTLNGRAIKIKGVCCHQDHAGVGVAMPDYLHYYRVGLLKEMGANALRMSHNPPAPELLDVCDSLGMLVMDETRLLNSGSEYLKQFETLVIRDRNHPSIFMWNIGNEEEVYQAKKEGENIARTFIRALRKLDPTRPCTYSANLGAVTEGINRVIPVRGFNYNLTGLDGYHQARPEQPVVGTEVGSTVTTRGVYETDTVQCYVTDFDENYPPWASTAEQWWQMSSTRPWFMGGFVWTGFDYRGEPTPYQWPNIGSHFGIMDLCGFPKNIYYYYQSWWTDKDVLHIAPHWNWAGKEGQPVKVWVNTNAKEVELFLNGKSLGKKIMPVNGHLNWDVIYKPGKLHAVAYKNGRKLETTVITTGAPHSIVLQTDKKTVKADGKDAVIINVSVIDSKGNSVPDANAKIDFELEGDARIIGLGNGDPSSHEPDMGMQHPSRHLFNGKCQLIIRSGNTGGTLKVTAKSISLNASTTTINQLKNE